MMSRHFGLSSGISGAIAKRLPHAKNQLSVLGSFFNQFVIYIYIYIQWNSLISNSSFAHKLVANKQIPLYIYTYTH